MILDRILDAKRAEVAAAKTGVTAEQLRARDLWHEPRRGFADAIRRSSRRCIIAEIKRASPSKGLIRRDFDAPAHARAYERAGATCLSVLTDAPFFQGALSHLESVRYASGLPLLRKDFIIDVYQMAESRAAGADAILLIVAALDPSRLRDLAAAARDEGLDVLTEVHDERELEVALKAGAKLIGINNRDLRTFATSTDVTRRLMSRIPADLTVISESGLSGTSELRDLESLGVRGFLIGETFMAAEDPGSALTELLEP